MRKLKKQSESVSPKPELDETEAQPAPAIDSEVVEVKEEPIPAPVPPPHQAPAPEPVIAQPSHYPPLYHREMPKMYPADYMRPPSYHDSRYYYSQPPLSWYYIDNHMKIQGPFPTEQMRRWFETGSFYDTLMLSIDPSLEWKTLKQFYPKLDMAFLTYVILLFAC